MGGEFLRANLRIGLQKRCTLAERTKLEANQPRVAQHQRRKGSGGLSPFIFRNGYFRDMRPPTMVLTDATNSGDNGRLPDRQDLATSDSYSTNSA
jgi:hypothetical protein